MSPLDTTQSHLHTHTISATWHYSLASAHRGGTSPLILNVSTGCSQVVSLNPRSLYPRQPTELFPLYININGPGSTVGIATDYGLDGPGIESSGLGGLGVCMLASGTQDRGFAPDRSRRIFPATSTACSTIRYKRQLKVQYQDNEAQDTAQKKTRWGRVFSHTPRPAHPASCTMGTGSFPGVKRPRRGADHPPPLGEVKNE
jgi:hypothetical protein